MNLYFTKKAIRLLCGESRLAHSNNLFREKSIFKVPDIVTNKTELPTQLQARLVRYRYA